MYQNSSTIENQKLYSSSSSSMNYELNEMQMNSDVKEDRRNKIKTRGEDDDEPVNVNDVQL